MRYMREVYKVIILGPRTGKALDEGKAFVGWRRGGDSGRSAETTWKSASTGDVEQPGVKPWIGAGGRGEEADATWHEHRAKRGRVGDVDGGAPSASEATSLVQL